MIKKIFTFVLAASMMLFPCLSAAEEIDHLTFHDEQVSIDVPHGLNYRENIKKDYTGCTEEAMRMTQVFLVYEKGSMYMNLDYIADEDGTEYDMSTEENAMKMFDEIGETVMRDDISSSGVASSGEMGDPEYFTSSDGTGYIKVEHKSDGSEKVNMITYLTCSGETCFKMFVLYGKLDKENERYDALSEDAISQAEAIIGTYKDSGYDMSFLTNEKEGGIMKGILKWAFIGLIVGGMIGGLFFVGKQTRKMKKGERSIFSKNEPEVKIQSVKDAHANRGKNPNAKKAVDKNKKNRK